MKVILRAVFGNTTLWLWTRKRIYVCSRQRSGGPSKYQKKHPERHRKLESKKTGCRCRVVIKQYPHTETILGRYTNKHDHEIGQANAAYTRPSRNAREQIKTKLMQNVDPKEIVGIETSFFLVYCTVVVPNPMRL
jgi:transposase